MRTRRWTDGDLVWFGMSTGDAALGEAAAHLGYQRVDGEWARHFPADARNLDRAWINFTRCALLMTRQAAKREAVPWETALDELCRRAADVDWFLVGSAAIAVRGGDVAPGDIDVVCSVDAARELGEALADALVEPVAPAANEEDGWISAWWGRAFHAARIEWAGGIHDHVDDDAVTEFGPTARGQLETVRWRDWSIRVPPLAIQRAVNERRELTDRVATIDQLSAS